MYSQILRFTLPRLQTISSQEFQVLRETAVKFCSAQYFGYTVPTKTSPLPRNTEEICWAIQWHDSTSQVKKAEILSKLAQFSPTRPTSLLLQFHHEQIDDLAKALEARVSEFAMCCYVPTTPFGDPEFKKSSEKTFTDCYLMRGFVGGQWGYVLDGNDTNGVEIGGHNVPEANTLQAGTPGVLKEEERRLAVYYLGWESTELHQAATKTPLFAEEINKLSPYFGPGTGAFYVTFTKHE